MFQTLDKKLITLTQWSVRQCELFLYLKRTAIGKLLAVCNFFFALPMLLSIIGSISQKKVIGVFVPVVLFFLQTRAHLILWRGLNYTALWTNRVPRDIQERRGQRLGILLVTIFMAIMCTVTIITSTNSNISRIAVAVAMVMSSLITLTAIEYFLCTVSIYPEK